MVEKTSNLDKLLEKQKYVVDNIIEFRDYLNNQNLLLEWTIHDELYKKLSVLIGEWYKTSIEIIKNVLTEYIGITPKTNAYIFSGDDTLFGKIIGGNWDYYAWAFTSFDTGPTNLKDVKNTPIRIYEKTIIRSGSNYKIVGIRSKINPNVCGDIPNEIKNKYDFVVIDTTNGKFKTPCFIRDILRPNGVAIRKDGKPIDGLEKVFELKEWYIIPFDVLLDLGLIRLHVIEGSPDIISKPVFYQKTSQ